MSGAAVRVRATIQPLPGALDSYCGAGDLREALPLKTAAQLVLHSAISPRLTAQQRRSISVSALTPHARDSTSVTLNIPAAYRQNVTAFMEVEEIEVARYS